MSQLLRRSGGGPATVSGAKRKRLEDPAATHSGEAPSSAAQATAAKLARTTTTTPPTAASRAADDGDGDHLPYAVVADNAADASPLPRPPAARLFDDRDADRDTRHAATTTASAASAAVAAVAHASTWTDEDEALRALLVDTSTNTDGRWSPLLDGRWSPDGAAPAAWPPPPPPLPSPRPPTATATLTPLEPLTTTAAAATRDAAEAAPSLAAALFGAATASRWTTPPPAAAPEDALLRFFATHVLQRSGGRVGRALPLDDARLAALVDDVVAPAAAPRCRSLRAAWREPLASPRHLRRVALPRVQRDAVEALRRCVAASAAAGHRATLLLLRRGDGREALAALATVFGVHVAFAVEATADEDDGDGGGDGDAAGAALWRAVDATLATPPWRWLRPPRHATLWHDAALDAATRPPPAATTPTLTAPWAALRWAALCRAEAAAPWLAATRDAVSRLLATVVGRGVAANATRAALWRRVATAAWPAPLTTRDVSRALRVATLDAAEDPAAAAWREAPSAEAQAATLTLLRCAWRAADDADAAPGGLAALTTRAATLPSLGDTWRAADAPQATASLCHAWRWLRRLPSAARRRLRTAAPRDAVVWAADAVGAALFALCLGARHGDYRAALVAACRLDGRRDGDEAAACREGVARCLRVAAQLRDTDGDTDDTDGDGDTAALEAALWRYARHDGAFAAALATHRDTDLDTGPDDDDDAAAAATLWRALRRWQTLHETSADAAVARVARLALRLLTLPTDAAPAALRALRRLDAGDSDEARALLPATQRVVPLDDAADGDGDEDGDSGGCWRRLLRPATLATLLSRCQRWLVATQATPPTVGDSDDGDSDDGDSDDGDESDALAAAVTTVSRLLAAAEDTPATHETRL